MSRIARRCLLIAGLWGLTGCQQQGSSPGSSRSPENAAAAHNQALPAAPGETSPVAPANAGTSPAATETEGEPVAAAVDSSSETNLAGASTNSGSAPTTPVPVEAPASGSTAEAAGYVQGAAPGTPAELPQNRTFRAEGPEQALRITYDDLDLLKWLQMDPVTPDCPEKMPGWMRGLNGKKIRLRGFMKPHEISTGFRRFIFVKDTGLCCFGPAGKIYDLIQVTLLKGTTTDYIELTPFDVIGTFRIELAALDDTQEVYELFHIDDAKIVRK